MSDPAFQHDKLLMLRQHLAARGITDSRLIDAMGRIPREQFVGKPQQADAYADRALTIGCGQTISQPYIVALMTQALALRGDERVLEIGTGSGYQTAILAELAREVASIERHEVFSQMAGQRLVELGYDRVKLLVGDGTLGWTALAPYDRILVTAAAARLPQPLIDQLAPGGILVIPVGGLEHQVLQAIRKDGAGLRITTLAACRFVPLVGAGRLAGTIAVIALVFLRSLRQNYLSAFDRLIGFFAVLE